MDTLFQRLVDQSDVLSDERIMNIERLTTDDVARVRTNVAFQLNHVLLSPQAFYSEPTIEHALRDSINARAEATTRAEVARGVGSELRDIDITGEGNVVISVGIMKVEDEEDEEKEEKEEEKEEEGKEDSKVEEKKEDVTDRIHATQEAEGADRLNIRRGERPMNEFLENDKLFLGAFPMLFFIGEGFKGKGSANCDFIRHLMRQHDNRFARCLPLMFGLFNQTQRHLVCTEVKSR